MEGKPQNPTSAQGPRKQPASTPAPGLGRPSGQLPTAPACPMLPWALTLSPTPPVPHPLVPQCSSAQARPRETEAHANVPSAEEPPPPSRCQAAGQVAAARGQQRGAPQLPAPPGDPQTQPTHPASLETPCCSWALNIQKNLD